MAQPFRTPQDETAKLKLVRVCRECGGPLGPRNEIGVCQQTPECRKVSKRLHARGYAVEAKAKNTYRNCLGCGDQLSLRNTTDYCQAKPDCQHQSDRQYARNRREKMRAARTQVSVRPCKNCRKPLRSDNTTDYCTRKRACRNLNVSVHQQRRAEANGEVREKRFCLDCGAVLAWNNRTDICQSNPDCRPHSRRLGQRNARKRQAELRIRSGRQPTCNRCMEPLRSDDSTGYCMTNETCRRLHNKAYQQIREARREHKSCESCGRRLRADSVHGVCAWTTKCRKELDHRKNQAKWYRDHDASKAKARASYRKNHKQRREYANRRNRERHKPVVQETAERINTKEFAAVADISINAAYYWRERLHPAIGRPIKTWNTEDRPDGSSKPILWSRSDANKIAAWQASTSPSVRLGGGAWRWGEREFRFTTGMAACVELLYKTKQNRSPSLKDEYILETAGLRAKRLIDVFRVRDENGKLVPHPAWGAMVVRGDAPGTHQLADPPTSPR